MVRGRFSTKKYGKFVAMEMTNGFVSVIAPGFACLDSGSDSLNAGSRVLAVVVTIRKISTTNSTSISDTMITEGVRWCLRGLKCMSALRAWLGRRQGCGCEG